MEFIFFLLIFYIDFVYHTLPSNVFIKTISLDNGDFPIHKAGTFELSPVYPKG